jgi:hypothetical protein
LTDIVVPDPPEGGFVLALVVRNQPVDLWYRAYSSDFDPSDVLKGSKGRYTPFSEAEADSMLLHGFGQTRTTDWQLFSDDGYAGTAIEWGAVIQPSAGAGYGP